MAHEEELKQAIELIKVGQKKEAAQILSEILDADPQNERAWLWVTTCVDNDEERRYCLEQVLQINPKNAAALKAMSKLAPLAGPADPAPAPPDLVAGENRSAIQDEAPIPAPPPPADSEAPGPETASAPESAPQSPDEPPGAPLAGPDLLNNPSASRPTRTRTVLLWVLGIVLVCGALMAAGYFFFNRQFDRLRVTTNQQFEVEYIVSGSSPQIVASFLNALGGTEALDVQKTPFSRTDTVNGLTPLMLVVENTAGTGTVACEIKVDGKSISTASSSDPAKHARCSGVAGITP